MLIGITGKKRSGKDQFAAFLSYELMKTGATVKIFKFANPLKDALLFGATENGHEYTYDDLDGKGVDRERSVFNLDQATAIIMKANEALNITEFSSLEIMEILLNCKKGLGSESFPGFSIREMLQFYGTEVCRKSNDNFWVDYARRQYQESESDFFIITDVRFDNELNFIKNSEGFLFRINRENNSLNTDYHASENGITDYSYAIDVDNNHDLKHLKGQAEKFKEILCLSN